MVLRLLVAKSNDEYIDSYQKLSPKISIKKVGGSTRAESVLSGLNVLECEDDEWILVHDAVRCCLTSELLNKLITQVTNNNQGGILASAAIDTIKSVTRSENEILIEQTLPREQIYQAQTPQMFRYNILKKSLENTDLKYITDEASAVEKLGVPVAIIEGCSSNIKVTKPIDRYLAEFFLRSAK